MKRSSFKQLFILKKKIYGMPVNWAWSFEHSKWQPAWIYDRHDFSYFWSTSHPNASYQVSSQLAFQVRRRGEK